MQTKQIKICFPCNQEPKIYLNRILSNNCLGDGLIRPVYKFAKLVTKTKSKMQKPKTYDKAMNDPINENKWHEVIDKEL